MSMFFVRRKLMTSSTPSLPFSCFIVFSNSVNAWTGSTLSRGERGVEPAASSSCETGTYAAGTTAWQSKRGGVRDGGCWGQR